MMQPPEVLLPLWSALADITKWFDWDALSAIGTVGALWFAVVQSSRAGWADRSKAVGILTFLTGLLGPIEVVSIYDDTEDADLKAVPRDEIEKDLAIVRRARDGIAVLPLSDASAVGVVEWVMALPLALNDIEEALDTQTLGQYTTAFSSLRYVQEAMAHFKAKRHRLRSGLIVRTLRSLREGRWHGSEQCNFVPVRFSGTLVQHDVIGQSREDERS
jgi:hypothetical protein